MASPVAMSISSVASGCRLRPSRVHVENQSQSLRQFGGVNTLVNVLRGAQDADRSKASLASDCLPAKKMPDFKPGSVVTR